MQRFAALPIACRPPPPGFNIKVSRLTENTAGVRVPGTTFAEPASGTFRLEVGMKRREFLKSMTALAAGGVLPAAPAVWSPAKAQARQETLLIVSESGPNNIDIHGVGTNVPGYEVSWNCYDRLISHEMKTLENGTQYYDRDKFKMVLADDMNVGDMSVTFKLKKQAVLSRRHAGHGQGRQMVARSRRHRRRLSHLPDGSGLAVEARAVRRRRRQHDARRFHAHGPLTCPDLAVIRAGDLPFGAGQENANERTPGSRIYQQEYGRQRCLWVVQWDGRQRGQCSKRKRQMGRRPACPSASASLAHGCPPPATACAARARRRRHLLRLPNKDFVELKTPASSASCRRRIERHPVSRHESHQAAVRQSEGAPGGRLRDPVSEDHGRGAVRPREADVRRAAGAPTEVAWPQPHSFNTDIAKAKQLLAEPAIPTASKPRCRSTSASPA
jgi:peptide/nickel transport system substrate-binding protein